MKLDERVICVRRVILITILQNPRRMMMMKTIIDVILVYLNVFTLFRVRKRMNA